MEASWSGALDLFLLVANVYFWLLCCGCVKDFCMFPETVITVCPVNIERDLLSALI